MTNANASKFHRNEKLKMLEVYRISIVNIHSETRKGLMKKRPTEKGSYLMVDPPFPIMPPHELFGTINLTFDLGSASSPSSVCIYRRKNY